MSEEGYKPTEEETQKAEETMTEEQKMMSQDRESWVNLAKKIEVEVRSPSDEKGRIEKYEIDYPIIHNRPMPDGSYEVTGGVPGALEKLPREVAENLFRLMKKYYYQDSKTYRAKVNEFINTLTADDTLPEDYRQKLLAAAQAIDRVFDFHTLSTEF